MKHNFVCKQCDSRISFRPCPAPTVPLLFGARSSGHCVAPRGWQDRQSIKNFVQLFWTVSGCGWFVIDGQKVRLPERHAVIFHHGEQHRLGAVSRIWDYRFMTIDGAGDMTLIRAMNYPRFPVAAGPCPEELFIRMAEEVLDVSPNGQRQAAGTAFRLLLRGCSPAPELPGADAELVRRSEELMRQHYREADFNINRLADLQVIHRSRLSRIFHTHKGIPPIEYLKGLRLHKALSLLKESQLTVTEIARLTGYASADYCGKSIRRATGMTPNDIRRE